MPSHHAKHLRGILRKQRHRSSTRVEAGFGGLGRFFGGELLSTSHTFIASELTNRFIQWLCSMWELRHVFIEKDRSTAAQRLRKHSRQPIEHC